MPDWLESLLAGLTNVFLLGVMLFGLFGMVIPIFPGGFIIWLAVLAFGLLNGLSGLGLVIFIIITAVMIAGIVIDDVFMAAAARKHGASWWSLLFAFLGGVAGTIMFPPFGGLLGAPGLLYLSEYVRHRSFQQAWLVTRGMLVGWGWSFVARFGLGTLMIGLWWVWLLVNPT
ncbi:MAG TPA: DUF456 domain-containing protein [Anaerolineales bacterium]|nr:DUF456 domain-containing protein [Anaerolineales bacterium]